MTVMENGAATALTFAAAPAEVTALRGALRLETRLAEALACRSRGLIEVVEALSRRALDEARDIGDARVRLDRLSRRMRLALEAGETAEAASLSRLAERTLAVFETAEGPRIVWDGPEVGLSPEAARLAALTLFELASRSLRHGALALAEGRAGLGWWLRGDGALRLSWREYGAAPDSAALRAGVGGALLPLLAERFGGPLRVRATPFGLRAELTVPAADLMPSPARVLRMPQRRPAQSGSDSAAASGSGGGRSRT